MYTATRMTGVTASPDAWDEIRADDMVGDAGQVVIKRGCHKTDNVKNV